MRDSKGIKIKLETAKDQFDMVGDYDDRLPPDTLTGIPQLKTVDLPSMKGCYQAPTEETVIAHAHGPSKTGSMIPPPPTKTRADFDSAFAPMDKSMTVGKF